MKGILEAIYCLTKQKKELERRIRKEQDAFKKKNMQNCLVDIDESMNFLKQKVNDFIIYTKNTDNEAYKILVKHYFECVAWDYCSDLYSCDSYRKAIERACKRFDVMSNLEKDSFLK